MVEGTDLMDKILRFILAVFGGTLMYGKAADRQVLFGLLGKLKLIVIFCCCCCGQSWVIFPPRGKDYKGKKPLTCIVLENLPNSVVGDSGFVSGGATGAVTLLEVSLVAVPFVLKFCATNKLLF